MLKFREIFNKRNDYMEIKILCKNCAGVVDGAITDSETGEYPCKCPDPDADKKRNKIDASHWKNFRERFNSYENNRK